MIDHEKEHLLSMTEAAKQLPGRPNVATLWRWRTSGCRGIKLETVLSGGRRYTSVEALRRFLKRVTDAADGAIDRPRTSRQRAADISRAEKELSESGW
jgi:hypothetical protein